jgi:hypothetical protein
MLLWHCVRGGCKERVVVMIVNLSGILAR